MYPNHTGKMYGLALAFVLFLCVSIAADGQVVSIQNRWKSTYLSAGASGPVLVNTAGGEESWQVEIGGFTGFIKLKHLRSGQYLHAQFGSLALGPAESGWKGAMWSMEVVGDYVRFKNRLSGKYLHCEYGNLQVGDIQTGWWSAMWSAKQGTYVSPDPVQAKFSFINEEKKDGDPYNPSDAPQSWLKYATEGWMGKLPDATPVRDMSIPGTHDAGALYGGIAVECQTWSIAEQLEAGIRYLDIRCRRIGSNFTIHHGHVYQKQSFGSVMKTVTEFLRDHPTETVIMKIKEEHKPESGSASFQSIWDSYVARYGSYIYRGYTPNPTLGQLRGKVYIVCQADCYGFGMNYGDIAAAQRFYKVYWLAHQETKNDDWATLPSKKKLIRDYIDKAQRNTGWVVNQLNGSTGMSPRDVARATNRDAYEYLGTLPGQRKLGLMVMDFPGERLIYRIIKSNFDFSNVCNCPAKTIRKESPIGYVEVKLPEQETGSVITIDAGSYRLPYGSTCYGIYWDELRYTCDPNSCTWKQVAGKWLIQEHSSQMGLCVTLHPGSRYMSAGRK